MAKGSSKNTAIIQRLLEERRQYEAWIARLSNAADATPEHVRARVRADYEARLAAVTEELRAHADSAHQAIEQKRHLRSELQKKEALATERLTENELRHAVGEYDEAQWSQVHKDILAELLSVREELQSVEADVQKLEELDTLVGEKPTAAPRSASPSRPQAQPGKGGQEDELAFIKSVTEDEEKSNTPSARRASGAQFQPVIPAETPRAPSSVRSATPSPAPVLPQPSGEDGNGEAPKTLRCKECGTLNLPTEWYCEQCGAELAAV
jgi:hypothetical protein